MQPTFSIIAPAPGMIFINGRFCGEASPAAPLLAPIQAFGPCFLEYRPLQPGFLPMARRIVMSGGSPLPDSLSEDVFTIRWPGGITEIELSPEEFHRETSETLILDGISLRIIRGEHSRIEVGNLACSVPRAIRTPALCRFNDCIALIGEVDEGRYILTLSTDLSRQTGFLQADRLDFESEDILRAATAKNDIAGHATLERWKLNPQGLQLLSTEPSWIDGAPHSPSNPEETARAAVEAALLGLFEEAGNYLTPALRMQHPLDRISDAGSLCLPMKYGVPDGRACIGLLQVENDSCAVVHPIYYHTEQSDERWLLTELSLDSGAHP